MKRPKSKIYQLPAKKRHSRAAEKNLKIGVLPQKWASDKVTFHSSLLRSSRIRTTFLKLAFTEPGLFTIYISPKIIFISPNKKCLPFLRKLALKYLKLRQHETPKAWRHSWKPSKFVELGFNPSLDHFQCRKCFANHIFCSRLCVLDKTFIQTSFTAC